TEELLSHLECHQSSETIAAQAVRAGGLNLPNLGEVMGGELLNGLMPHAHSIKAVRYDSIERTVTHPSGQRRQKKQLSAGYGNEEGGEGAALVQCDQRGMPSLFRSRPNLVR